MDAAKQSFEFTLVLPDIAELTDSLNDALYEAGCGDALIGWQDGAVFLDFTREAESVGEAVRSAIASVESVGLGIKNIQVEPEELAEFVASK